MTIWSHTQGVYPLRDALAELLKAPPDRVRVIHMEGSGCYGHNGADDAMMALIVTAFPAVLVTSVMRMRRIDMRGTLWFSTWCRRPERASMAPTSLEGKHEVWKEHY